jgi:hypothetical protein
MQVKKMREDYGKLDRMEMSIWECCELLNEVVDESDPDLDEPQIEHLLQTAEAIRKDYPNEDWLHLTGLIHGTFFFFFFFFEFFLSNLFELYPCYIRVMLFTKTCISLSILSIFFFKKKILSGGIFVNSDKIITNS